MTTEKPKNLLVNDQSATGSHPVRIHELMIDGIIRSYKFEYGKKTELPYEIGIKFMKDGFDVYEPGSDVPMRAPAVTDTTSNIRLAPDEVVARLDELTDDSLVLRVALKPGGEKLAVGEFDREKTIAFLKGAMEKQQGKASEEENLDLEDMSSDGIVGDKSLF